MKTNILILIFFLIHQSFSQQCGGEVNDERDGEEYDQGQCGGEQDQHQDEGCGGEAGTEKEAFLNLVGVGEQGGCGGGYEEEEEEEQGEQCGGESTPTLKDTFLDLVGVGGNGGCGGGGEQQDSPDGQCGGDASDEEGTKEEEEEESGSFISQMMSSFYTQYENLSDKQIKEKFFKFIPTIDNNTDQIITFEELHHWVFKEIEEETQSLDLTGLDFFKLDTNQDGQISWDEYKEDHLKQISDQSKVSKILQKERIRFDYVDKNKNGMIDTNEQPRLAMPDGFQDMNEMTVDHFLIDYDINNDGEVTKQEFNDNSKDDPNIYNIDEQFEQYDVNNDKILQKDEIRTFVYDFLSAPHITKELKAIYNLLDKDGGNKLTYEQFNEGYEYFTYPDKLVAQEELDKFD